MNAVITSQQAKQITRGRTPLVPVCYETACKALAECVTLDDAQYWDNSADALAAWAKIYHDGVALRRAKQLRLKAHRRMAEIAATLRPGTRGATDCGARRPRGPRSLLMERGMPNSAANAAVYLAQLPSKEFHAIVEAKRPRSPTALYSANAGPGSDAWKMLFGGGCGLTQFRSFCRRTPADGAVTALRPDEAIKARAAVVELQEWLDEFEQHLPKQKKS